MKDFRGKGHFCEQLGTVTLKEFETHYNNMARSVDMLPTASNLIPLTDSNGCTLRNKEDEPLFSAVIFYETKPEDNRALDKEGKVYEKPKMEI